MSDQIVPTALERFAKLAPTVAAMQSCQHASVTHEDGTTGIILCHPTEFPPSRNLSQSRYVHLRKYGGIYYIYYVDNRPKNLFEDWPIDINDLFGQNKPVAKCEQADIDKVLLECWNKWCEKNPVSESI